MFESGIQYQAGPDEEIKVLVFDIQNRVFTFIKEMQRFELLEDTSVAQYQEAQRYEVLKVYCFKIGTVYPTLMVSEDTLGIKLLKWSHDNSIKECIIPHWWKTKRFNECHNDQRRKHQPLHSPSTKKEFVWYI